MRSILAAAGAGGPGCPPRSRALDLPEGCGRVRCSSCRQSARRTCRNSSCLRRERAPGYAYSWSIRRPFLDDANGLHHGRERARRRRTRQGAGPAGQAARRLPMQSICISAEPRRRAPRNMHRRRRTADEQPRHREAARRPHARAASGELFRYSVVLRLFFSWRRGGPPSGKCCRLRRHPASRRRIDASPVDGLDVRRSVSC